MVGQVERWIPGYVAPDEAYWNALLRDGELGRQAAPHVDVPESPVVEGGLSEATYDSRGSASRCWQEARRIMEREEIMELPVVGCNRGGVMVQWNDLRGFVPASHLEDLPPLLGEDERQQELHQLVGSRLALKILELDPQQGRFVLSERATHQDEQRRQEILNALSPGDICEGHVTTLCSFGAFVDLGGLEGLIHISELSWGRVDHPRDVLSAGQQVEVYVLNVDRDRGRVGLSLRRLKPDPWQAVEERYRAGQIVEGTVTHVVDFGAFVEVEDGLEGLIHVSELQQDVSAAALLHPRDVVQPGDTVRTRVLNVDGENRRIGLSMRLDVGSPRVSTVGMEVEVS